MEKDKLLEGIYNKGVLGDKIRHSLQNLVVPKGKHNGTCTDVDSFRFEKYRFQILRYKNKGALIYKKKILQSEYKQPYIVDLSEEATINY